MNIYEAIQNRRSVRQFADTPVPREIVERLIDLGRWAPSNCNVQGWRFIVIDDDKLKQSLVDNGGSTVITEAPLGILVCYFNQSHNIEYTDWLQSASAAVQNILLSAHASHLGSCWICHLPTRRVLRKLFKIPNTYTPCAYVALGYPKNEVKPVPRHIPIKEIYEYNLFPLSSRKNGKSKFLFAKIVIRKGYYCLPVFIKKALKPLVNRYFIRKFDN